MNLKIIIVNIYAILIISSLCNCKPFNSTISNERLAVKTTLELQETNSDGAKAGKNTCEPATPIFGSGTGFRLCILNRTNDIPSNIFASVSNGILSLQSSGAFLLGRCFCKHDCSPSQLVCQNPEVWNLLLPSQLNFNVLNGFAQLVHQRQNYQVFCYCPELVEEGVDPCTYPETRACNLKNQPSGHTVPDEDEK